MNSKVFSAAIGFVSILIAGFISIYNNPISTQSIPVKTEEVADPLEVPELPEISEWFEVTENQELSDPALYLIKDDNPEWINIKLPGREWGAKRANLASEYQKWFFRNGWSTSTPFSVFGGIELSTISADGVNGSVGGLYKVVGDKIRVVNIADGEAFTSNVFVSDVMTKDQLLQIVNQY